MSDSVSPYVPTLRWRLAEQTLLWLPALVLCFCVAWSSHPMPYFDEWEYANNWLRAKDAGGLPWAEIFRQHSIHWQPWPKLLVILVCHWGGGDMRVMCWMGVAMAAATAWMLWRLCLAPVRPSVSRLAATAALGLCLFSPGQAQSFVWGACFLVLVPVFSLTGILYLLRRKDRLPLRFLGAGLLSLLAAGSYGSGLIVWCAVSVYLFFSVAWVPDSRRRWPWIAGWMLHGIILSALVLRGFTAESGVLSTAEPVKVAADSAVSLPWFIAVVAGLHLGSGTVEPVVLSGVLGLLCAGGSVVFFIYMCRCRSVAHRTVLAPWLALASFAGVSAVLIGWGRHSPAGSQMFESRYNSSCHFLSLALLVAVLLHLRLPGRLRLLSAGFAGGWFCLSLLTALWGWEQMGVWQQHRQQDEACVRYLHFATDDSLNQTFPGHAPEVRPLATALAASGRLAGADIHPQTVDPASLRRVASPLKPGRARIEHVSVHSGRAELEGYCFLPRTGRPADLIVLSTIPAEGPGRILSATRVEIPREYGALRAIRLSRLESLCRWQAAADLSAVAPGTRLRVEAFDAEYDRLFLLPAGVLVWDGTNLSAEPAAAAPPRVSDEN